MQGRLFRHNLYLCKLVKFVEKKIAFKTLGCRLNIFETDALVSQFRNAGYEIVDFNKEADAYIVNTCTVTNQSDKKSRQETGKASRTNKDAVLVVTGCMATNQKETLEKEDRITYVVDNEQKSDIFHCLIVILRARLFLLKN